MITIFGSINMDLVARVRSIARPGETVLSRRADSFFGGKGANQAVAAARISGKGATRVAMAGAVGRDPFGKACLDNLTQNGVDVEAIKVVDEPTGCAFITVDEHGENAITVASGANMAVRAVDVPRSFLSDASVLVLQMEVPLAENLEIALRARRAGATILWNFAPVPAETERAAMADMLAAIDVLVVNEHEAVSVAAMMGKEVEGDYLKAASLLAHTYGLVCIVTAGAKGAVAVSPDGSQRHVAARLVVPVDTTGAGDTFVGVLAYGLAEGREVSEAMQRACVAASLSCLTAGAQAGMPSREMLEEALSA
ncbi:ribokinase [Microvirga vignae]|uniref:Ribokinase n=1 Tax=Microvirga vignae TaxID=1225564 RepID=A0A0H1R8J7_9HYPH|nr:ribokinase [Microvirga vignae]KLK91171.1 ribokinase [Microvirga vignae]